MKEKIEQLFTKIDDLKNDLIDLSKIIHENPEIKWQEFKAVANIKSLLNMHDIELESIKDLPTAFTASIKGKYEGPTIAFLAEYDALPAIGHACGHNLIAMTNVGAFLSFLSLENEFHGEIRLIGTPAEEGGGGKISLLDKNVFDDIDISISSHGSSNNTILWQEVPMGEGMSLATSKAVYKFHGKASHAAINPDQGVNALNSVIMLFNGIDSLRQHLKDDARVHGIITDGGQATNIVPAYAEADILMRSKSSDYVNYIREQIDNIAKGAALMTGAELEISEDEPGYKHVIPNTTIGKLAKSFMANLDIKLTEQPKNKFGSGASTDFGNISHEMPSYAFHFSVSETPVAGHSIEMERASISDIAHNNAVEITKGMSATAYTLLCEKEKFEDSKSEFTNRKKYK
jgi:amidohydrolase